MMTGGEISGNLASSYGGGIFVDSDGFSKTGGIIYGYVNEPSNKMNRAMQGISANNGGHAVYAGGYRRERTAGLRDNLSIGGSGAVVGWEN